MYRHRNVYTINLRPTRDNRYQLIHREFFNILFVGTSAIHTRRLFTRYCVFFKRLYNNRMMISFQDQYNNMISTDTTCHAKNIEDGRPTTSSRSRGTANNARQYYYIILKYIIANIIS